ncbi:MAG TPA: glycerophosphodiester phosphodiesterase family protein [Chloroflexota bacterium]|nr:glycerophosphodiester phosphodiesterase family protein [Chloroflexota bacterium]
MTQPATGRHSLAQRLRQERGRVWIVGHRGAMGYRPENTLASYEYALQLGADWIECDCHLSRDGALVIMHDESVDRTTNGHGLVRDHTLAELKQLDAGSWFSSEFKDQRVLTVEELLDWARQKDTVVDIEIKNAPLYYGGIEDAVIAALKGTEMTDQAIVISFDHRAVGKVKALDARVATGVLYACRPADGGLAIATAVNADALLPHWAYVTREDVDIAHTAGLSVAPWATSDPAILQHLIAAGVDGIGTNHPDVLRRVLDEAAR